MRPSSDFLPPAAQSAPQPTLDGFLDVLVNPSRSDERTSQAQRPEDHKSFLGQPADYDAPIQVVRDHVNCLVAQSRRQFQRWPIWTGKLPERTRSRHHPQAPHQLNTYYHHVPTVVSGVE